MNDISLALSFNDVLLQPQYSDIDSRNEVDLATTIAPGIDLKIPLITVNMDTVTGVDMAGLSVVNSKSGTRTGRGREVTSS